MFWQISALNLEFKYVVIYRQYLLKVLVLSIILKFILFICVLVGVAFLTLFERKILGYIQIRKGPNKLGVIGILQPFSDAIKLFTKEGTNLYIANYYTYLFSPVVNLFLSLIIWIGFLAINFSGRTKWGVIYLLCLRRIRVYSIIISGWSSNSNYSLLGGLRSVAQTISYEASLFLIFLSFLVCIVSLSFERLIENQEYVWFLFIFFPLCLIFLISSLAETNRTPFDLAEGESELVSGFNVEYSRGGFAFIFLAEYSNILLIRFIRSLLFLGGNYFSLRFYFKVRFISFFWLWVRGTLPRVRYDKLMYIAWKRFLPVSLSLLVFFFRVKIYIYIFILIF